MVFVPFTGIDNHKKCVTFGAGLLSREDGSSYSWMLREFLKVFKKQPTLVLTDQDLALNKVVNEVFPMSSHRFCVWHITKNCQTRFIFLIHIVLSEYSSARIRTTNFRKRFHYIIWNSKLEPHDLDKAWQSCLYEFNKQVDERDVWVAETLGTCIFQGHANVWSYENYIINNTLTGSYLLIFLMTFEGVMEHQRRNQFVNDFNTATTVPRFITSSPYEPHASKVYTRKIFYQVQKEISDFENTCFQMSVTSYNGVNTIIVLEKQKNLSTMQPTSPVVDDKLEEYHYGFLTKDT
uniref:MULE transposase domain-containing protein n=1 Tax=Lactuca sativa TaxID=4236 RepID=A0A9R1UI04_LACSA|nr:hypothetical protein LSAT_V11C900505120 [Lactuca sativa]